MLGESEEAMRKTRQITRSRYPGFTPQMIRNEFFIQNK